MGTVIALITGPIPGSSLVLLALDVILVYDIAKRYGTHLSLTELGCATIGVLVLAEAVKLFLSTALEFVPAVGWWLGKPLVTFLGVLVLGYLADHYFRDRQIMGAQRRRTYTDSRLHLAWGVAETSLRNASISETHPPHIDRQTHKGLCRSTCGGCFR